MAVFGKKLDSLEWSQVCAGFDLQVDHVDYKFGPVEKWRKDGALSAPSALHCVVWLSQNCCNFQKTSIILMKTENTSVSPCPALIWAQIQRFGNAKDKKKSEKINNFWLFPELYHPHLHNKLIAFELEDSTIRTRWQAPLWMTPKELDWSTRNKPIHADNTQKNIHFFKKMKLKVSTWKSVLVLVSKWIPRKTTCVSSFYFISWLLNLVVFHSAYRLHVKNCYFYLEFWHLRLFLNSS